MSERIRNIYDMLVGTREFNAVNFNDYKTLPDGALKSAIVGQVIAELEGFLAEQSSGASGQAVEQKSVLIAAARQKMKEFSSAARALNLNDAGFRRLFRLPDANGVQKLIAAGREFVGEATKHKTELARLGITDADIAALGADLDGLEIAAAAKAGASMQSVGATAGIDDEIQRGMDAEMFLDAMLKIVYRNNAAKLGEWKSARHVRRSNRPAKPIPPPS